MTLLISALAAVICTVIWYRRAPKDELCVGVLCWIYWGATLMWLADAIFAYAEQGAAVFTPTIRQMADDAFLGLAAVVLGLVIWLVILLIRDPRGVISQVLFKKNKK